MAAMKYASSEKSQARKRKRREVQSEYEQQPEEATREPPKRRRKAEVEVGAADNTGNEGDAIEPERNSTTTTTPTATTTTTTTTDDKPNQRFIVFIGNLPYTTTDAALKAHFAKIKPSSIRHRTEKGTNKSKGYAFLEFDAFDRMNTCLKLYHHSLFDDGKGGKPRKLNVELTAGGGGSKSEARKEKLKTKNSRLNEQRKRSKLKMEALEREKRKHEQKNKHASISSKKKAKARNTLDSTTMQEETITSDIHPSRRHLMMS